MGVAVSRASSSFTAAAPPALAIRGSLLVGVALFLGGCGEGGATGPGEGASAELTVLSGSGQFGEPGEALPVPFEVRARGGSERGGIPGRRVVWRLMEGSGGFLEPRHGVTDATGRARSTLTLGPNPGRYRVLAALEGGDAAPVEFRARGVSRPSIDALPEGPVAPGDTLRLTGRNLVPEAEEMAVLFSGIRGKSLASGEEGIDVVVPPCLSGGRVEVEVALGAVRSEPRTLRVLEGDRILDLAAGASAELRDAAALSCVRLPRDEEARYVAVVHSASPEDVQAFPYRMVARVRGSPGPRAPTGAPGQGTGVAPSAAAEPPEDFVSRPGEQWIRSLERELLEEGGVGPFPSRSPRRTGPPEPGTRRTFQVLAPGGAFEEVIGEVRRVGERVVIYVDLEAPDGGLSEGDLEALAELFDTAAHPEVTRVFGAASDVDGNGRVIVLFTPVVNRHTERGDDGFVGGFFFGADLLPGREGSNGGEILYALVPDPVGRFGDPRSRRAVRQSLPAILAHELQHMVHFNGRVRGLGARTIDELWLSEALATSAEDLVARHFSVGGDEVLAERFRRGNLTRAARYLRSPARVSLVAREGVGTLEERGAGWLFLEHLRGRFGGDALLGALTRSTRSGVENVEVATGVPWSELVEAWSGALFLDDLEVPVETRFTYVNLELRNELTRREGRYPLRTFFLGGASRTVADTLRGSSSAHFFVAPRGPGGVSVNLSGAHGGPLPPGSEIALTLIRMR